LSHDGRRLSNANATPFVVQSKRLDGSRIVLGSRLRRDDQQASLFVDCHGPGILDSGDLPGRESGRERSPTRG
jgi:hypothetical protein